VNINELQKKIYHVAKDHGWHDRENTVPEIVALLHTEISELMEEYRKGHNPKYVYYSGKSKERHVSGFNDGYHDLIYTASRPCVIGLIAVDKPEGIASELADIFIRVLDAAEMWGIDLEPHVIEKINYNETRPYKHGNKII